MAKPKSVLPASHTIVSVKRERPAEEAEMGPPHKAAKTVVTIIESDDVDSLKTQIQELHRFIIERNLYQVTFFSAGMCTKF